MCCVVLSINRISERRGWHHLTLVYQVLLLRLVCSVRPSEASPPLHLHEVINTHHRHGAGKTPSVGGASLKTVHNTFLFILT